MPTANLDQAAAVPAMSDNFEALRTHLANLAIAFERRRQIDAADLALSLHALIGELRDELDASEPPALTSSPGVEPCPT